MQEDKSWCSSAPVLLYNFYSFMKNNLQYAMLNWSSFWVQKEVLENKVFFCVLLWKCWKISWMGHYMFSSKHALSIAKFATYSFSILFLFFFFALRALEHLAYFSFLFSSRGCVLGLSDGGISSNHHNKINYMGSST